MGLDDEILLLLKEGKKFLDEGKYKLAKTKFLDAAEISLNASKSADDENKKKFEKYARSLIEFAKVADEKRQMKELDDEVISDMEPMDEDDLPRAPTSINPQRKTSKTYTVKKKNNSSAENKLQSDLFGDYSLKSKREISIPMGESDEQIVNWQPGNLMNGIMMVTGGSGSGKTEWLRSLIIELTEQGFPVTVIDLHGDIDANIPTISIDYTGKFGINPLELISKSVTDGGPLPQINRLVKLLEDAVADGFSSTQSAYIRSVLQLAYHVKNIRQEDPSTWDNDPPTFKLIRDVLLQPDKILSDVEKSWYVQDILGTRPSTIAAVKNRLLPILDHPAFSADNDIPIKLMFEKPIRIILKSLNTVDMQFIVADTLLRHLFSQVKSMGHTEGSSDMDKFRLFVIIDEVKILTGNRGDLNDSYHILNRLATEARKFGMGMILASQVIRHFGRDVRSNSASKLVLRPMDSDEAKKNAKELEISQDLLMDINQPGRGYYVATDIDNPIQLQLFSAVNRPYDK